MRGEYCDVEIAYSELRGLLLRDEMLEDHDAEFHLQSCLGVSQAGQ